MPSAEAVIAALTRPETWPDYASEIGRFTPLRARRAARPDVRDRGRRQHAHRAAGLHARLRDDHDARDARTTRRRCAAGSRRSRTAWPATARTSRARCPRAASRSSASTSRPTAGTSWAPATTGCCSTRYEGKAWVQAAGTWDPMPWHLDKAYQRGRQRGPARVLGPARRRGAEHAAPAGQAIAA